MIEPQRRGTPDFTLLALTFLLVGFGIVMVFSASSPESTYYYHHPFHFTIRQAFAAALGSVCLFVLMNIRFERFKKWFIVYTLGVFILLILVLFSEPINNAKSWIHVGPLGLQPSEFAKLAIILYLAAVISKKGDKVRDFQKGLLPLLIVTGVFTGLILLQPDMGTAIVFMICAGLVILVGGVNLIHFAAVSGMFLALTSLFAGIYLLIADEYGYRVRRFTAFLDPWSDRMDSGWHLIQSFYALAHGGWNGAGFGQSIQKLHYLPEAHNDFIFAVIAEELGFVGVILFFITYLGLIWRGILIAVRCSDVFGTLAATGIVSMFAVQALINIGGVSGAIPITGITLPFISSGGSSLLVSMMSVGVLLSISRENNRMAKTNHRSRGTELSG